MQYVVPLLQFFAPMLFADKPNLNNGLRKHVRVVALDNEVFVVAKKTFSYITNCHFKMPLLHYFARVGCSALRLP